jgi:hypothetical protein
MVTKYIKIKLHGARSYIQPIEELATAIEGELDGLSIGEKITLDFEPIDMTEEEYNELPEFDGH